jgi:hypothetical protein
MGSSSSSSSSGGASSGGVVDTSGGATSSSSGVPDPDSSTGDAPTVPGCPECTLLAGSLEGGRGIAVDDAHVYFTDEAAGTVERVSLSGGDRTVIASNQGSPYAVAASSDHVYWTIHSAAGAVMRATKDGGAPEFVDDDAAWARGIDLDDTHVYWTRFAAFEGALHRRSMALDEDPELLYTGSAGFAELAVGTSRVFVTSHEPASGGVAFIEPEPEEMMGTVLSVPLAGDLGDIDTSPVGGDVAQPWGIAVRGSQVYFATGEGGASLGPNRIFQLTIGSPPATQLTSEQTAPWGVAADDEWVYFTDHSEVKAVPTAGGEVVVLAAVQNSARSIAVAGELLVWVTKDSVVARPIP